MKKDFDKMSAKGIVLAAAGIISMSTMLSGCFGNDDKLGVVDTVSIVVDTSKAIINFGIGVAEWEDDIIEFVNKNQDAIKAICPDEMKAYEMAASELKRADGTENDDEKGEALKQFTASAMDLLKKFSVNDTVDSKLRSDAETLANRYMTMYEKMKEEMTKHMPDAGKEELDKAFNEAFKPVK